MNRRGDGPVQIELIDYSPAYYLKGEGDEMPAERKGKFVQMRHADTEYLVLSPKEAAPYHAHDVFPLSKSCITFKKVLTGYTDLCYDITIKYSLAGYSIGVK